LNPVSRSIFIYPIDMAATQRTVKRRDAHLEKLYSQYSVSKEVSSGVKKTKAVMTDTPVLTLAEAAFVRRDLARVAVAALITLIIIVAVWSTSGAPYWTNFIDWLAQVTHF